MAVLVEGRLARLSPQQRTVLALLLLEVGKVVPAERLVEALWVDDPPRSAREVVQVCVSRIRRVLRRVPGAAITAAAGGYRLDVDPQRVDLHRFRSLAGRARSARDADAARLLREALDLWQGVALTGVAGQWLPDRVRPGLEEERLAAVEERVDADLRSGLHDTLITELTGLVGQHPVRERMVGQLMLALYRAGRAVDALEVYRRAGVALAEELGLDPGPALRDLQGAILRNDAALRPPASGSGTAPHRSRPRQLPASSVTFTGRTAELAELLALAGAGDGSPPTVVISAIDGMAGIGKTALAVHTAHRLADRFPDGQLFLDLHGYTHKVAPVDPADALDRLLRALGVPGPQIPHHVDDRAALYRTILAGRRMLLLLDNAHTETQVHPLLPGAPGCLVLITSRNRLVGLDDTALLSLDVLPVGDAIALFGRAAGTDRLAAEPPQVLADVVDLCGRLPLALRIAAARLRTQPTWTTAHLADRLRDHRRRLAELDAGHRSVAAALDLSYHHLTGDQQRLYQLLGLHPGTDIEPHAAAVLARTTVEHTRRLLDGLAGANLLTESAPGRYQFHDLVRDHATRATTHRPEPHRRAALTRLLDHYARTTRAAADLAYPSEAGPRPDSPPADGPAPAFPGRRGAEEWLDAELDNLLAAAHAAAAWPHHVQHQSAALHLHLHTRGHHAQARSLHTIALDAARRTGDAAGELRALAALGDVELATGGMALATAHYCDALDIASRSGDRAGEARAVLGLGHISYQGGRYEQASGHYRRALRSARAVGDHSAELFSLIGLGHAHRATGRYDQAVDCLHGALALARQTGNRHGELGVLTGLGNVHHGQGRFDLAADYYQQAATRARETGHRGAELNALTGLGHVHLLQGKLASAQKHLRRVLDVSAELDDRVSHLAALTGLGHVCRSKGEHRAAADYYHRALDAARALDDRNHQFEALHGLAHNDRAAGHARQALANHQRALDLAVGLDQPADQARAHNGLARAHRALGNVDAACEHWQRALTILTALDLSETEEEGVDTATIRAALADARP